MKAVKKLTLNLLLLVQIPKEYRGEILTFFVATGQGLACLPRRPTSHHWLDLSLPSTCTYMFQWWNKSGVSNFPLSIMIPICIPVTSYLFPLHHHHWSTCTHTTQCMLSLPTSPIRDIVSHPLWWVVVLKEGDTFTFLCIHFHYIITDVHNIMNNASWYHGALPPAYPVRIGWSVSPHIYVYCIGHP